MSSLEYHPERLQQYFASLPDDDPRRLLWREHIGLLQRHNREALDLIKQHYGRIQLPEFREVCDRFREHVEEWEVMWKALRGEGSVPAALSMSGKLMAPQYPGDLDGLLEKEIKAVERLA